MRTWKSFSVVTDTDNCNMLVFVIMKMFVVTFKIFKNFYYLKFYKFFPFLNLTEELFLPPCISLKKIEILYRKPFILLNVFPGLPLLDMGKCYT